MTAHDRIEQLSEYLAEMRRELDAATPERREGLHDLNLVAATVALMGAGHLDDDTVTEHGDDARAWLQDDVEGMLTLLDDLEEEDPDDL